MSDIFICPKCQKYIAGDKETFRFGKDGEDQCFSCGEVVHEIDQTDVLDDLREATEERDKLREALEAAAKSLESLAHAGSEDHLIELSQIRGYARSRARVARFALENIGKE